MAFSSRLLSKSKQLYSGHILLQREHAVPVRFFAKEAAPRPALKGDEMLKNIFLEVKNKFETAMSVLRKEKITIDPNEPAAVQHYAKVMKTVREKGRLVLRISKNSIHHSNTNARYSRCPNISVDAEGNSNQVRGLTDELGAEAMMMDALEKIEKELKKPLMRNDKKGMGLLMAEFDKINKKLGIRREDLPKYEEQLELKIAKAQLEELKKEAVEAMETQKKREEFKDEAMADVKSLDIRNFL
ncbi:unnamed protein product [Camellia sinensis]